MSPKVVDILGYEPDEVIGKTLGQFIPEDEAKRYTTLLSYFTAQQTEFTQVETGLIHKDGHPIACESSASPIFGPQHLTKPFTRAELLKTVATRLEKKAVVEERNQQKLDDLRSTITLAIPRELLTPLNAIADLSNVLMNEGSSMEQIEIVEVAEDIYNSTQTLHRLVQNFLLYAQLELLVKSPERIKALRKGSTPSVSTLISDWAIKKAQQLHRATDSQLDLKDGAVQISQAKLKKIVEELVDNACKFSLPGSPVQLLSNCSENTFILYVVDRGRGMSAEQIENLGAYVQFERKLDEQQGSGLGLTIAKRLTELHGGELGIESIPGKQTTVRMVLPLVQE